MATQTLVLDGVLASSGLNNATVANLNTQDGNWATATATNTNTSVRASMPTPSGTPNAGANLQTITVQTRKNTTNSGNPTATISVGVNGTKVLTSSSFSVTSTTGETNTFTFDFSAVTGAAADGSDLEVWVDTTSAGGSPSTRNSVDIGYVAWTADYSLPSLNALSWGSGGSVSEGASDGTLVGTVSGRTSSSTLSLFDDAGGRFTINSSNGQVTKSGALDYESNTTHDITVRESLSGYSNSPRDTVLTVTVTDVSPPSWVTGTNHNNSENDTLAISLNATGATSYSINGGADAAHFELNGTTLRWASNGTKNYEDPQDADTNNIYVVTVDAVNSEGTTSRTFNITITNDSAASDTQWAGGLTTEYSDTFDTGLLWNALNGGWTVSTGAARASSASSLQSLTLDSTVWQGTGGTTYTIECNVTVSSGVFRIGIGSTVSTNIATSGFKSIEITPASSGAFSFRGASDFDPFTGSIDNLVIKSGTASSDNPQLEGDETTGTHVANLNKPSTASLEITGGTGSSMFELYNNSGTWGIRTSGTLSGGNKTLEITDTTLGAVGSGEENVSTLTIEIPAAGYQVQVTSSSFDITTNNINVRRSLKTTVESNSFDVVSQTINGAKGYTAIVASQTIGVTDPGTIRVLYDRRAFVEKQTFNIAEQTVSVSVAFKTSLNTQSFAVTSQDVQLKIGRKVSVASANFTTTSPPLSTLYNRIAFVDPQTFTITPYNVGGGRTIIVGVDSQSLTVTPSNTNTLAQRSTFVGNQQLSIQSNDIAFSRSYVCKVEPTQFVIASNETGSGQSYSTVIDSNPIEIVPQDIQLVRSYRTGIDSTNIAITPQNVELAKSYGVTVESHAISLAEQNIDFSRSYLSAVLPSTLQITTNDAGLFKDVRSVVDVNSISVNVNGVSTRRDYKTNVDQATFSIAPSNITLVYGSNIFVGVTSRPFTIESHQVNFVRSYRSVVESATVEITPHNIGVLVDQGQPVEPAQFAITSQDINVAVNRKTTVESNSVAIAETDVGLAVNRYTNVQSHPVTITSSLIGSSRSYKSFIETQSVNWTPQSINVARSYVTFVDSSQFVITTFDTSSGQTYNATVEPHTINVTTNDVALQRAYRVGVQHQTFEFGYSDIGGFVSDVNGVTVTVDSIPIVVTTNSISHNKGYYVVVRPPKYNVRVSKVRVRKTPARVVKIKKRVKSVVVIPRRNNVAHVSKRLRDTVKIPRRNNTVFVKVVPTTGTVRKMHLTWETKDPSTTLDYIVDWTDWLGSDLITTADATLEAGDSGLSIVDVSIADQRKVVVLMSGGTNGKTGTVNCTITTAGGKVGQASVSLLIRSR